MALLAGGGGYLASRYLNKSDTKAEPTLTSETPATNGAATASPIEEVKIEADPAEPEKVEQAESEQSEPEKVEQSAEQSQMGEAFVIPYYGGGRGPEEILAEAAVNGNFGGAYRGMKASRLKGLGAKRTSENTLQVDAGQGYKILYVFDGPVGDAANPSSKATITGVAINVATKMLEERCDGFESEIKSAGATATAVPHLYRLSDGNYASAGYVTKSGRFWVYYYYPNSPTRNEAAPRR